MAVEASDSLDSLVFTYRNSFTVTFNINSLTLSQRGCHTFKNRHFGSKFSNFWTASQIRGFVSYDIIHEY